MRAAVLAAAALFLGACAADNPEPVAPAPTGAAVTFASDPAGASVETTAGPRCRSTPCTLDIASEETFVALYRLGDRTRILRVEPGVSGTVTAVFEGVAAVPVPTPVSGTFEAPDPTPPPDPEPVLTAAPEPEPAQDPEPAPEPQPLVASAPVIPTEDKPLFEGSPYAFTATEIAAFCAEPWTTRRDEETGRTEY
ncbi:MAG: hypothetical protein AAFX62_01935, partial [Pseudomonadota bacterium]